jgi:hypothetical protein
MRRPSRQRTVANLSESVDHQAKMYALAASAAGVGALCSANPAQAKIVYTPANVVIVQNGGPFLFDLNDDGIADFRLNNGYRYSNSRYLGELAVVGEGVGQRKNKVWYERCEDGRYSCAAALPKGKKVGPKGNFSGNQGYEIMALGDKEIKFGPWWHVTQAYLGINFVIKGKIHFGWARVKISSHLFSITATLTGYAYETIPGKAIIAGATKGPDDLAGTASTRTPEPATLGTLALGASGLSIWRREESVCDRT